MFAGVPREEASNDSVVVEERNFHHLLLIFAGVPLHKISRICIQHMQSLHSFSVISK